MVSEFIWTTEKCNWIVRNFSIFIWLWQQNTRNIDRKKYDTNYKGQKYNTLKRHVYLPSVEDLQNLPTSTKNTRDAIHTDNDKYVQYLGQSYGNVSTYTDGGAGTSPIPIGAECFMCPAFIVNLSKVDYELVK